MSVEIIQSDCLEWMKEQKDNSVDMTFGSPPYEDARTYGIDFKLKGDEWVQWMADIACESVRISSGLVAFVVEGKTRKFSYSATPVLLMAELVKRGVTLRKPPVFHRIGIPGSGGPDWLRNDYEFIVCATSGGKLPWSDNTAMGHPPKWAPGGEMSHRLTSGSRVNQWGHSIDSGAIVQDEKGGPVRSRGKRPSHMAINATEPKAVAYLNGELPQGAKLHTKNNGSEMRVQAYVPPKKANPGNVIHCKVGGGLMGSKLAHENEAPFPEKLAEFFVMSFCPPGGVVLDPFSGSGTTAAVAEKCGRSAIGIDVRESQVELGKRRLQEINND